MAGKFPKPGSTQKWQGTYVRNARAWFMTQRDVTVCARCGRPITGAWHLGHRLDRQAHPDLTWDPDNWQAEHPHCSTRSGAIQGNRRRAQKAPVSPATAKVAPGPTPPVQSPQRPDSGVPVFSGQGSFTPAHGPIYTPPGYPREWPRFMPDLDAPWLRDLADIPPDAHIPAIMSPPHPDAVGSYGMDLETWVGSELGIRLRWWQQLATRMQLQHDAAGRLLIRQVLESTPRRAGKSVRLRSSALFRLHQGADTFGEQQLVMHTGKDLPICKEIHRRAWPAAQQWGWAVRRQNGNEEIERPDDGSRWMVRGRSSVYGYDVCLGMVDEAWGVEPGVVDAGLEPAMLERVDPQLVLTSTAHRRATALMVRRLADAVVSIGVDPSLLLLWWGAAAADDVTDRDVWRAASPHWSEQREQMMSVKLARALRGERDPEDPDEDDPLESFRAQYLNVWPRIAARRVPGDPLLSDAVWSTLISHPTGSPSVMAVEAWFGQGLSVASAWPSGDGPVVVSVAGVPDVAAAARLVAGCPRVVVGKSIAADPAWSGVPVDPAGQTSRNAAMGLRQLVADGVFRHDGGQLLTEQVYASRVLPGVEGPRLVPGSRLDAVKAAVWAVDAARATVGWFSY